MGGWVGGWVGGWADRFVFPLTCGYIDKYTEEGLERREED